MKTLQELTLLDRFLFDEAMEDKEIHEALLKIILGEDAVRLLDEVETEKELRTMPWLKSIRVDVFAVDDKGEVYNTEMQKQVRNDLIKRSRYYQALIDSSLLQPGETDYNKLNDCTIVMITPYDLFGQGKYLYEFCEACTTEGHLYLGDGARRIFVNTHGKNVDEVSPELVELCYLIEYNEAKEESLYEQSKLLDVIRRKVKLIQSSEKVGVKYMQKWEADAYIRQETRIEMISEFISKGGTAEEAKKMLNATDEEISAARPGYKANLDF